MNACSGDRKRERTYEGESVHVRDDDFIIQCNRDGLGFKREGGIHRDSSSHRVGGRSNIVQRWLLR